MSATLPDLRRAFRELEARLQAEPEGVQAEIASGVYLMSPRPRPRHGNVQGNLFAELSRRFGLVTSGAGPPEWIFVIEPEIRSERTFSRLIPDVAGWRRSAGWPDIDVTPVTLIPDWVAEVLSPSAEATDRNAKLDAYGAMGVGWLWLVDPEGSRIETFSNLRGRMVPGPVVAAGDQVLEPFGSPIAMKSVFSFER